MRFVYNINIIFMKNKYAFRMRRNALKTRVVSSRDVFTACGKTTACLGRPVLRNTPLISARDFRTCRHTGINVATECRLWLPTVDAEYGRMYSGSFHDLSVHLDLWSHCYGPILPSFFKEIESDCQSVINIWWATKTVGKTYM